MPHKAEQLILHCGLAKTGSTAIQKALFASKEQLLERYATLYPGSDEQHFHFQSLFAEKPDKLIQIQRMQLPGKLAIQEFLSNYRDGLLAEIDSTKPRRIIISSEYFSGMSVGELRALHEFLKTVADEITLFCYLRDPWSFSISLIQEMIRNGQLKGDIGLGYVMSDVEILAKFEEVFGVDPVVAPYIPNATNVVADFFRRFSLGVPPLSVVNNDNGMNQGMERETAALMLYLNEVYPTFNKDGEYIADDSRDWMIESLMRSAFARTPLKISRSTADRIYEQARENIEFIEHRYFGDEKVFTRYYNSLKFEEFDDALTWKNIPPEKLVRYLVSCMRFLSDRGVFYYRENRDHLHECYTKASGFARIIREHEKMIASLSQAVTEREVELQTIRQSTSWKLTAPLRRLASMLRGCS